MGREEGAMRFHLDIIYVIKVRDLGLMVLLFDFLPSFDVALKIKWRVSRKS